MKFPVIRWNRLHALATATALVVCLAQWSPLALGAITGWDFEDGTLQGWTNPLAPPTTGPLSYVATADPPGQWQPLGAYFPHVDPFDNRDLPHDQPLVLRSPAFSLIPGESIVLSLLGGDGGGAGGANAIIPTSDSTIVTNSSSTDGFLGVALRRNSDGAYLLTRKRTNDSIVLAGWAGFRFDSAELDSIIASNPGETYTLDLIDTAHGSFGAISIDNVFIPTVTDDSVVEGGGQWNIRERISSAERMVSLQAADALLALPSDDPSILAEFTGASTVVNFHDFISNIGHFGNDEPFISDGGVVFAGQASGVINVVEPGTITFGIAANDGARLTIDGTTVVQRDALGYGTHMGSIDLTAGPHVVELTYYQDLGGATIELYVATSSGAFTSLNHTSFELLVASDLEPGVPGDFDGDGDVDGRDFLAWQRGETTPALDPGLLAEWQAAYNGDGPLASAGSVPEPGSLLLIAMSAPLVIRVRRRS